MTLENTILINPNLYVLCQEAQELIQDGWTFKEGYPVQISWQFHAILEREPPKKAGRPPNSAAK
jgi:hypothetical protein